MTRIVHLRILWHTTILDSVDRYITPKTFIGDNILKAGKTYRDRGTSIRETPSQFLRNWVRFGCIKLPGIEWILSGRFKTLSMLTVSSKRVNESQVLSRRVDEPSLFQALGSASISVKPPFFFVTRLDIGCKFRPN